MSIKTFLKITGWLLLALLLAVPAALAIRGQAEEQAAAVGPQAVAAGFDYAFRPETAAAVDAVDTPPAPRDKSSKIASSLQELGGKYREEGGESAAVFARERGYDIGDGRVTVVLEVAGDAAAAVAAVGGSIEAGSGELLQARVPLDRLEELSASPAVERLRPPHRPVTFEVKSEAVSEVNASAWQANGHTGAGVKIAIIDPGFTGYDQRIAAGELPANLIARSFRSDNDITGGGIAHGTACAELVHDLAPGSQLYLVNFNSDAELSDAVDYLITQGVDVISASWGFLDEFPGDGSGPVNAIVARAQTNGILWVNSAGNTARTHWGGAFSDLYNGNGESGGDSWHEFFGSSQGNGVTAQAGQYISGFLSWNRWPASASDQDYDLYLYDSYGALVDSSTNVQDSSPGSVPAETIFVAAPASGNYYFKVQKKPSAAGDANLQLYSYPNELQYQVWANSLGGQPTDSAAALSVGAVATGSNPVFLENFSSRGPTVDGRTKPDIVAPDRVSTATYGAGNFWGTSPAAPHVAGAAAQLLAANPSYTPLQLQSVLEAAAAAGPAGDLGAPGKDSSFGSGKLYLGAAPAIGAVPRYYFTWYDQASSGMQDWLLIGNTGASETVATVVIGGQHVKTYQIPAGGRVTPTFPGLINGPVQVISPLGSALIVSQRVLYNGGFTELPAVRYDNLASEYYFTWYDQLTPGMQDWVLVSNQGDQATTAEIYIHGSLVGSYPLNPGEKVTPTFNRLQNGPVRVRSANGQRLVVSQRVLYNGFFNEITGTPAGSLAAASYFTWYDQQSAGATNWVLVANPDAAASMYYQIEVGKDGCSAQPPAGTACKSDGGVPIAAGEKFTPTFPGLLNGPVAVKTWSDADHSVPMNSITSQRVLWGSSFEEVQGTTLAQMAASEWFAWYDQLTAGMRTWVLIANPNAAPVTARVYVGGEQQGGDYAIAPGSRVTPSYPGLLNGPVKVVAQGGEPLLVSERTLFNNSFNEILGIVP